MADQKYECPNCGGSWAPGSLVVEKCDYCGEPLNHPEPADNERVIMADLFAPQTVNKEEFDREIVGWIAQGDYTPIDILQKAVWKDIDLVYLPFYQFSGTYAAQWTASCGYGHTETYTEYRTEIRDGREVRVPHTESRIVYDWRQESGQTQGDFTLLRIAAAGLPSFMLKFVEMQDIGIGLEAFQTIEQLAPGAQWRDYQVSEEDSYQNWVQTWLERKMKDEIVSELPGDIHRNLEYQYSVDRKAAKVYLPFWIGEYRYGDQVYRCIMDGRRRDRIEGERPVDQGFEKNVGKSYNPFWASLVIYIAGLVALKSIFPGRELTSAFVRIGPWVVLAMLILGIVRKSVILSENRKKRQEKLKAYQAEGPSGCAYCGVRFTLGDQICPQCGAALSGQISRPI